MRALPTAAGFLMLLLSPGCAPKVAPAPTLPAPAPPRVRIPPGCEADQSGEYVHAGDPSFRYLGQDDGGTLLLSVERRAPDGGEPSAGGRIRLERTPRGFVGETRAQAFTAEGRACPADFPTEVLACEDGGLLLRSAATAAVDEACRPPEVAPPAPRVEQRLVRVAPGGPGRDGG